MPDLRVLTGGDPAGRPLLLLHGLGAGADVWSGVADRWPGRWVAPDLPGHGRSGPLPSYSFAALADAVADLLPDDGPVDVLGHSLGGVVALALAARRPLGTVVGLGIKVAWSDDDLARAAALAERPHRTYDGREPATQRALLLAGLGGLVEPDDPRAEALVRPADGGWQPALDPRAFAVGAPDLPALLAAAHAERVVLARGEHDPMVSEEQLAALVPDPVTLPGCGHSAMVEAPDAVAALLR